MFNYTQVVEIPTKSVTSFFYSNKNSKRHSNGFNLEIFGIDEIKLPMPPPQICIQETITIPKFLKTPEPEKDTKTKSIFSNNSNFQKSSSKLNRYNVHKGQCPYNDEILFNFYESESPDEAALVKTACKVGIKLLQRGPGFVCVWKDCKFIFNHIFYANIVFRSSQGFWIGCALYSPIRFESQENVDNYTRSDQRSYFFILQRCRQCDAAGDFQRFAFLSDYGIISAGWIVWKTCLFVHFNYYFWSMLWTSKIISCLRQIIHETIFPEILFFHSVCMTCFIVPGT